MVVERITAPSVKKVIDEHLQRHELKLDPKLHDVHSRVFSEGGISDTVKELKIYYRDINERLTAIEGYIKWLILLVMGAIIAGGLNIILK